MIFIVLAVLGLCLGSFVNALVWRIRQQETGKADRKLSIISGRSQCPHCHHELAAKDLVPVLSWLVLRGKCRYCGKAISKQYPLVELAMAAVLLISYGYWPGGIYGAGDWVLFTTWLLCSVGLLALFIYDIKWMLLPNKILYPTLAVAAVGRLVYIFVFSTDIWHSLLLLATSILAASGIFWVIYHVSKGKWIGYGDVRLGLVLGTLLASPSLSLLMIFVAAVLGSVVSIPALLAHNQKLTSRVPFGPYLIAATFIVMLYGQTMLDWYQNHFLN